MVLQELIETEASDVIGAVRCERTGSRVNERNGSRPRILAAQAGDIDLRIPKLLKGSFFPLGLRGFRIRRGPSDQARVGPRLGSQPAYSSLTSGFSVRDGQIAHYCNTDGLPWLRGPTAMPARPETG